MMNRRIIIALVTGVLLMGSTSSMLSVDKVPRLDSDSAEWVGEQPLEQEKAATSQIEIPAFPKFVFTADSKTQKVNIHNPEANDCLMVFTIHVGKYVLWQSGYCEPGHGYYEIELTTPLREGKYDGAMLYECYTRQGGKLNCADVGVTIIVQ